MADSVVAQHAGYFEQLHSDRRGLSPLKKTKRAMFTLLKNSPSQC